MNIDALKKDTDLKYINWKLATKDEPLYLRITGEPEESTFRGKPKFEFPIDTEAGKDKVLTLSQRSLNSLVDAAAEAGVSDTIDSVCWKFWHEGSDFDIEYFWEVADDLPF